MVKVVRFHEFGGPEVLQIEDLEVGEPGPGEVRVRVGAIGMNRAETLFRSGRYVQPEFPSTIGFDAAGVVEAAGEGVTAWKRGDRVATLTGTSMEQYGTYAEKILFPADMLAKVADGQSLVDAASIWMQYFTAYPVAAAEKGDFVVITAASSSVGLAAIQIANERGAMPIAVTRGRGKAEALREQGAAHVIVSDEEDIVARVQEITGGAGARIAFDAVGGDTLAALPLAMAPAGTIIFYGVLAGPPQNFPFVLLMAKNLTLRGFSANILSTDPGSRAEVIGYVNQGLASGALQPVIDRTFDLSDIVEAHRHIESNTQFGKIVVTTGTADE